MATTRTRKRRGVAPSNPTEVPTELSTLAVEYYTNNKLANACKGKAEKAREKLYGGMKDAGIATFDLQTNVDGKPLLLEASVAPGAEKREVDIAKLRKLVSEEDFAAIVSATVGKVEEIAGKDVLARCTTTVAGKENVTVKPKK